MTERTTVRLPQDLLSRAKRKAATDGRTLTALIEDGLRLVLADSGAQKRSKRVLPPISRATGGLMPGVDLVHIADLLGEEDQLYVKRTNGSK
jgi:hypothetical protein